MQPETWATRTRLPARSWRWGGEGSAVRGHSERTGPGAALSPGSSRRSKEI